MTKYVKQNKQQINDFIKEPEYLKIVRVAE